MKVYTYSDGKTTNSLNIANIQNDGTFTDTDVKTCSFRTFAPVSWSDTALNDALSRKQPNDILLHMYVELTNAHDKEGSSFLPKDCFLLSINVKDKPCVLDTTTLPLLCNGEQALYICYEGTTTIRVGNNCIHNNAGKPVVSNYTPMAISTQQESDKFHVFDF